MLSRPDEGGVPCGRGLRVAWGPPAPTLHEDRMAHCTAGLPGDPKGDAWLVRADLRCDGQLHRVLRGLGPISGGIHDVALPRRERGRLARTTDLVGRPHLA